ncbi:MAG: DNA/RNA non-specific endonuclease, partial [Sphingobacteriaceae bacterium]|nr:DNA/RNA non-specific endonuclease [Cytophagaceae bacterium]
MATQKKTAGKAASPNQDSDAFMDKLKQFVRTRGADYLRDDNISSVGIGYKQTDGKTTGELSIQFTVGEKVVPERLEDIGTEAIPPSFVIGGVEVPTDVIEREFKVEFRVVSEAVTPARKNRIDPVVPGVSVANRNVSAGTVGCVVFDRVDGTPYILSNWHVLHGPQGRIGDEVVQPGPHDDNRVHLNHFGKLVRSHLGLAGDCAIASIEGRGFKPEILELDVKVEELGEAELGDKVIKSGRTTAVTHGIVTRVDVIAKINYGGSTGERSIGGFEIGPDPAHPATNG